MADKYSAVWVSHSSMGDFIKCPRMYYLKNVYKDPVTKRKMAIVNPALSLGVSVHAVLEGLGEFPSDTRMDRDLLKWFREEWDKVSGERGGFETPLEEAEYKARGEAMIKTVINNPRFLPNKRVKLPQDKMNPNFFISEEDNIILNGLVDWIEYLPETDSLHIIDFKTGKKEESENSLQLPIYLLLCNALQKRKVSRASYWYLETDSFVEKELPDVEKGREAVLTLARQVKNAREKNEFKCPQGDKGCFHCKIFEKILAKDPSVVSVGIGSFNQDLFVIKKPSSNPSLI
jgi:ATP-dependent helicase/DNAse subunit B